jgi:hypothetical protein
MLFKIIRCEVKEKVRLASSRKNYCKRSNGIWKRNNKYTVLNHSLVLQDKDKDEAHLQYTFHGACHCKIKNQSTIIKVLHDITLYRTSQITAALNSFASPILTCRLLSILSGYLYARNS